MFRAFRKSHRLILRYHSAIGHLFTPNLVARMSDPKPGYLIQTNSQGFRSNWDFPEKKNCKPRILFFGDSNTAGDGIENSLRFSDIIGRELDCETYNLGLSGSGTDQQLLIKETLASTFEADLIIFCPHESNILRNITSYRPAINRITGTMIKMPKPFFELSNNQLLLHNQPVPKEREEMKKVEGGPLSRQVKNLKKWVIHQLPQSKRLAVRISDRGNFYASPHSRPWLLMRTIMERFVQRSMAPVVIIPLPSHTYYVDNRTPSYLKRFLEWHAEFGQFTLVDILPLIRDIPISERDRLHFWDDPHFNEYGHSIIAKALKGPVKKLLAQS